MSEHIVDIGDEVIRFAHDQGHVKASKDTINWTGIRTKCGKAGFERSYYDKKSRNVDAKSIEYAEVLKHLVVKTGNQSENNILGNQSENNILTAVEYEMHKDVYNQDGLVVSGGGVCVTEDYLINLTGKEVGCTVGFGPGLKKTNEASVKLTQTLQCGSRGEIPIKNGGVTRQSSEKQLRRNSDSVLLKREKHVTQLNSVNKYLTKISLSPKFRSSIQLPGAVKKTLVLPFSGQNKITAQIPSGLKVPIEMTEITELENGIFAADYHIWGHVTVTVWGKPYKLTLADVLDPKNNSLFTREQICLEQRKLYPTPGHEEQTVKYQVKGTYECRRTHYELKLKFPHSLLRRPLDNVEALKCRCDTIPLPTHINVEDCLKLTTKDLARIILRWRQIQYSFRGQNNNGENTWLWEVVKASDTEIGRYARTCHIDDICQSSNPIDKFLLTMVLWGNNCPTMDNLGGLKSEEIQKTALCVTEQLYKLGMPVPVISFLWGKSGAKEVATRCPIHTFEVEKIPDLNSMKTSAQIKMKSHLPDRVLNRLSQRWENQDGWVATALYLGVDLHNIHRLATNDDSYNGVKDKRMMSFKLWRMEHRRNSMNGCKEGKCSVWDLCEQLSAMGVQQEVFNFLWLDSETTP